MACKLYLRAMQATDKMTVEYCRDKARIRGQAVFGVEYGRECYAGAFKFMFAKFLRLSCKLMALLFCLGQSAAARDSFA